MQKGRGRPFQKQIGSLLSKTISVGAAMAMREPDIERCTRVPWRAGLPIPYSTVTDFARLRGWSTSVPIATAV
jgi:hypothetical protein